MTQRILTAETSPNVTSCNVRLVSAGGGIELYRVSLRFADPLAPACTRILWHEPMKGVLSYWSPTAAYDHSMKQWYAARKNRSSFALSAPVFCIFDHSGLSYRTVAVSEAERRVESSVCVNDFAEQELLDISVTVFESEAPRCTEFSFEIRIDERPLPMADCIAEVSKWWEKFYPPIPRRENPLKTNERPLYSSWYSFHQHPEQKTLSAEIELAAKMGFKSLIIDDGWSYDGPGDADYNSCGSWHVVESKFPDFAAFVRRAHELDIKVALWFPVPFIGINDPEYKAYEPMMLRYDEGFRAGILDPRFPEVRAYILRSYTDIVERYGLDGLKLDFIDSFCVDDYGDKPGIDCATVEEGINKLLGDIEAAFSAKDPDFMIEFRQKYVGPSIIRYCNMLRAGDCPFDVLTNRQRTLDVRMPAYPLAAHADMFYWAHDEDCVTCARMLLNTMFSVPQISVLLSRSDEEYLRVIENYIRWWDDHREILLHGKLTVQGAELDYSAASAEDDTLRITVLYAPLVTAYDGKPLALFNATSVERLAIDCAKPCTARVSDHLGRTVADLALTAGMQAITIPAGGRADIR